MAQNLRIHVVTPESVDWTSKIQVVDIFGPAESKDKKIKYLNLIIQDEQEDQVKAIVYGDDVLSYQDLLKLYHTYYITEARIQVPNLKYENTLSAFDWILDKKTIVDPIENEGTDNLPPPTKLSVTSFRQIKDHVLRTSDDLTRTNFDILAIVINCSQPRHVESRQKRIQELIVMDASQLNLTLTLWEDTLIEDQGQKFLQGLHEYPVILARRIVASRYNAVSLSSRFNTTIQINPPYPQAQELQAWITENKAMFTSFTSRTMTQSGFVIPIPTEEEVIPIVTIESHQNGQIFTIEEKLSFAANVMNLYKNLYVLTCIKCGMEIRPKFVSEVRCLKCKQKRMFIPRCRFEVNLQDSLGSAVGIITGKEAENLLSLPVEEIYGRAVTQNLLISCEKIEESDSDKSAITTAEANCPSLQEIERNFKQKIFVIRAKKLFTQASRMTSAKLYIQSCIEKQTVAHSDTGEGSKRKQKLEHHSLAEQSQSLKMKQKMEPPTPTKKG